MKKTMMMRNLLSSSIQRKERTKSKNTKKKGGKCEGDGGGWKQKLQDDDDVNEEEYELVPQLVGKMNKKGRHAVALASGATMMTCLLTSQQKGEQEEKGVCCHCSTNKDLGNVEAATGALLGVMDDDDNDKNNNLDLITCIGEDDCPTTTVESGLSSLLLLLSLSLWSS